MHAIARELDELIGQLEPDAAIALERRIRGLIERAEARSDSDEGEDANGFPPGYFENVVGSLEGQPFDYPSDPPPDPVATW